MKTKIVPVDETRIGVQEEKYLAEAGAILRRGGLVVFPTETVYGLGADAFNEDAARRIFEAKGRPSDNPLIVHIAEVSALERLCLFRDNEIRDRAHRLADAFWPGPLTMICPKAGSVPSRTTGGLHTVAIRMPAHETAKRLIREAGGFVAAPSANRSGRPSPTTARHCVEDMDGRVDMIIDGGNCAIGLESTIIDLTGGVPEILRPGRITEAEIGRLPGFSGVISATSGEPAEETHRPRAPGMKYRHYAPKGAFTIVRGERGQVKASITKAVETSRAQGKVTGVITSDESRDAYDADIVRSYGARGDDEAAAHNLYRVLREMDEAGAEVIFGEMPDGGKLSAAIGNRLFKASGGHVMDV